MPQFADAWIAGDRIGGIDGGWSAEVLQPEYGHDLVRLTGSRMSVLSQRYPSGAPVRLDWGRRGGQVNSFVGYVHHTRPRVTLPATTTSSGALVAVGASQREFGNAGSSDWPAGSPAQVPVQQAAFDTHFSSLVEPCEMPAAGGPIHGESQWAYLVRNARSVGFTLYCAATDLRFHSRRISQIAPVPSFRWYGPGIVTDAQVFSYDFLQGDDLPIAGAQRRTRQVQGITDAGELVRLTDVPDLDDVAGWSTTTAAPLTKGYATAVHGYLSAQKTLTAAREDNRFAYRAKVVVSGDERVHQTGTIALSGVDQYLNGYWYVLSARHRINTASYSLELELGRDALGDTSPATAPARQVVIGPGVRERERPSPPVLERLDRTHRQLAMSPEQIGRWSSQNAETRTHLRQQGPVNG